MTFAKPMAGGGVIPRPGSRLRKIMEMLPATNIELCDAFEMHGGEVARTMASLRHRGLVESGLPGPGRPATYTLTTAARAALSEPTP